MQFKMGAVDLTLDLPKHQTENLLRILAVYNLSRSAGLTHEAATQLFVESLGRSNCHRVYLVELCEQYPEVARIIAPPPGPDGTGPGG